MTSVAYFRLITADKELPQIHLHLPCVESGSVSCVQRAYNSMPVLVSNRVVTRDSLTIILVHTPGLQVYKFRLIYAGIAIRPRHRKVSRSHLAISQYLISDLCLRINNYSSTSLDLQTLGSSNILYARIMNEQRPEISSCHIFINISQIQTTCKYKATTTRSELL